MKLEIINPILCDSGTYILPTDCVIMCNLRVENGETILTIGKQVEYFIVKEGNTGFLASRPIESRAKYPSWPHPEPTIIDETDDYIDVLV